MRKNADITIFNIERLQTGQKLHRTILRGVFFDDDRVRVLRHTTVMTDDRALCIIQQSIKADDGKIYAEPKLFTSSGFDRAMHWTLSINDRVVRGVVGADFENASELDRAYQSFTITAVAMKNGISIKNWEVMCK